MPLSPARSCGHAAAVKTSAADRVLAPDANLGETVAWAVAHAVRAPSELNTQPWSFRSKVDQSGASATVEVMLDRSRLLTFVDPGDREALIACGAALENLILSLHGAELSTVVAASTGPLRAPTVLAEVTVGPQATEPAADRLLRLAIPLRTSHRGPFDTAAVPAQVVDHLVAAAAAGGAPVAVVDATARSVLGALDKRASSQLLADSDYQREVVAWSRPNTTRRADGVPGYARGLTALQSWFGPVRARTGLTMLAEPDHRPDVSEAPVLIVLGAPDESPAALLSAGRGLQRLLLTAQANGLAVSFCNAALHVPELRQAVGRAVYLDHPQVLLRLGYAPQDPTVPRRSVRTVLQVQPPDGAAS